VIWNRNGADKDIGVIDGYVIKEAAMKDYIFPEFDEADLRSRYETLVKTNKSNFTYGNIGFSMFERAWSLRGMENLLVDMLEEPDFVHQLLDDITDYNIKIIDMPLSTILTVLCLEMIGAISQV
jgi:uroporphyrinogen decarboxylase